MELEALSRNDRVEDFRQNRVHVLCRFCARKTYAPMHGAGEISALHGAGTSVVPEDRSVVGRHAVRKIQENLVDITPPPTLRRVIALDDWMSRRSKMPGGVLVGGAVTADHVPAGAAQAQVSPGAADLETFLASQRARSNDSDGGGVAAFVSHVSALS